MAASLAARPDYESSVFESTLLAAAAAAAAEVAAGGARAQIAAAAAAWPPAPMARAEFNQLIASFMRATRPVRSQLPQLLQLRLQPRQQTFRPKSAN